MNNPAPDCYQVKRNTDIEPVNLKRPCFFGHSYESYRRTCDIQKGVKVFDYAAEKTNAAQYYPNMVHAKKQVPGFSQSKAKQFTLWEAEEKKSVVTPGPVSYNQNDRATKPSKFDGVSLGMGQKCTAVPVKLTPGPGDYNQINPTDSAVVKKSHNMMLNTFGGIQRELGSSYRQNIIEQSYNMTGTKIRKQSAQRVKSGLSRRLTNDQGYGSKMAISNPEGFKLQEAILQQNTAKNVDNFMRKLDNSAENMMETPITGNAR